MSNSVVILIVNHWDGSVIDRNNRLIKEKTIQEKKHVRESFNERK